MLWFFFYKECFFPLYCYFVMNSTICWSLPTHHRFSYKGHLLGEPNLDKQQFYEYVLQDNIFIYHVHVRSKHLKSQCLLYWKYSKLLCIRTLIKLSYHTSSVEAVHSQVIFSFMIIFNCSFLSYLTFILLFPFVFVLVLKILM